MEIVKLMQFIDDKVSIKKNRSTMLFPYVVIVHLTLLLVVFGCKIKANAANAEQLKEKMALYAELSDESEIKTELNLAPITYGKGDNESAIRANYYLSEQRIEIWNKMRKVRKDNGEDPGKEIKDLIELIIAGKLDVISNGFEWRWASLLYCLVVRLMCLIRS